MNVFSSLPAWPRYQGVSRRGGKYKKCSSHRVVFGMPERPGLHPDSGLFLSQYADPVTDLLDRCGVFRARLFRESCVFHQGCYVKDLSRLGRDLRKTLILDNSPASYIFHPENAVSGPASPTQQGLGEGVALGTVGFPRAEECSPYPPAAPAAYQVEVGRSGRQIDATFSCPRCLCSPGLMTWQILSCST